MAQRWPGSRQRVLDNNGVVVNGPQVYFTAGGTTTPITAYQDYALTTPHARPVVGDAYGLLPAVYFAAGTYIREQVIANSVQLWQDDVQLPVETAGTSGGGGLTVSAFDLLDTGDIVIKTVTGNVQEFVRCNGRTIGPGGSGASERANDDTLTLYTFLWNNVADAYCPVSGGRGASAAADWGLGKTITLPDFRGRAIVGLNGMGNSASSALNGFTMDSPATVDTLLGAGGVFQHVLTQAQLPSYNLSIAGLTASTSASPTVGQYPNTTGVSGGGTSVPLLSGFVTSSFTTTISGTLPSGGSGSAHPNCQPFRLVGVYQKLRRLSA